VSARATCAGKDGDLLAGFEHGGQLGKLTFGRAYLRRFAQNQGRAHGCLRESDIAGKGDDRDPTLADRVADRELQDARHLMRVVDGLAVVAAVLEQNIRTCFLKVVTPELAARNLRSDGQDRDAAAMAVVEPVDEVHVTRAAASRADG
jgi:hypothetical protein